MTDASAIEFERLRPFLTGVAYRMLGSFADAQDVVQDAFLRWTAARPTAVGNLRAYLAAVVTRLCLDWLGSARVRREAYVGPWLPEPIVERLVEPPDAAAEDRIDAPIALMLALERLSPLERAAFVLHDLLEMEIADVADALNRTPAACRQLVSRARAHVGEPGPRYPVDPAEGERIAAAFFQAIHTGDVEPLRDLLAESAVLLSDGGGKVLANLNPIEGRDRILRFFAGVASKVRGASWTWSGPLTVSGLPGYVSTDGAGILQTTGLLVENGRIAAIYIVRNPEKLSGAEAFLAGPQGRT